MKAPATPTSIGAGRQDGTRQSHPTARTRARAIADQMAAVLTIDALLDALRRDRPESPEEAEGIVCRERDRAADHLRHLIGWRARRAA